MRASKCLEAARSDLGCQVPFAKAVPGVQEVVRSAEQANVRRVGPALLSKGFDVIELEKHTSVAATPVGRNKGAATAVSIVNLSPHVHRQITPALAVLRGAFSAHHWNGF